MSSSAALSKSVISLGSRGMMVKLLPVGSVVTNEVVVAPGIFSDLDDFDTVCT